MTSAVLLPLRLESRFFGNRLRLRVIPDEPWFDRHDPLLSAPELAGLERYVAVAADDPRSPEARAAWRVLAGEHGPGRACWMVRTFVEDAGPGSMRVVRPARLREEPVFTGLSDFPDRLQAWLARGGGPPALARTFEPIDPGRLRLDLPDPDDPDDRRWWNSWDEAVSAGLATEIDLGERTDDIDALYVVGLSSKTPAALFAKHRDAGRLGLVATGAPTNAVDGTPAADLGQDPMPWLELLHRPTNFTERQVSLALTGDRDLLGPLPGDPRPYQRWARLLFGGLWPALCGHTLTDVLGLGPVVDRIGEWATENLDPLGPYPALRVGSQPYGLLPATSLAAWMPVNDSPTETALPDLLRRLRARWAGAARSGGRGPVHGASAEHLLELLAQPPASPGYALRRMQPTELWFLGLLGTDHPILWSGLIAQWDRAYPLVGELGIRPRRRYSARGTSHTVQFPLVAPPGMPDGESAAGLLGSLITLARQSPGSFASTRAVTEAVGQRLDSLLLRLAIHSLQVAIGDVGRDKLGVPAGTLEPVATRPEVPQLLSDWIRAVTPDDLDSGTGPAVALGRVLNALQELRRVPDVDLERVLPAAIDCASHRIDPWVVGLARRRLRHALPQPPRLGGYGWVDAPRPGLPGPTAGRLLLAPSHPQALTAALIRDRAINDPEPGRWHLDLTSERVRYAARLADEVRDGAHPAEVLGREVERAVGDPVKIHALRGRFSIREEHRGRRVCDGQRVLAANPTTLGLSAEVLDELARLREAVDVYADLLVAEAVHHVVDGDVGAAGASLDAAAGLARPPVLDVLRTRRDGRAVETACVTVVADAPPPPLPADPFSLATIRPAAVADPATAAFLAARVGPASDWRWQLTAPDGTPTDVRLADLDLEPADALAVPLGTLERLVTTAAPTAGASITDRDGSTRYERAARLVALLGRVPALADDTSETTATPSGTSEVAAGELRRRLSGLRAVASALTDRLTAASGADERRAALQLARRWGIAPEPDPSVGDPPADQVDRARRQLEERVAEVPDDAAAGTLDPTALAAAIAALASPTGQIAVLGRLRRDALPPLVRVDTASDGGDAGTEWLSHVAPVRASLARLEAHQLAVGTPAGSGPAWSHWTNHPEDPWQTDPDDRRRLVVAYVSDETDLAAAPPDRLFAVGLLDRFTETVPSASHTATAAFGFDAPGARAPQAILLAVRPELDRPLDEATLVGIVAETRELAHARMATPADLDDIAGVAPLPLLPATGDTSSGLET